MGTGETLVLDSFFSMLEDDMVEPRAGRDSILGIEESSRGSYALMDVNVPRREYRGPS